MSVKDPVLLTQTTPTEQQRLNVDILKEVFTCYSYGDIDGIIQRCHPDVRFVLPGDRSVIPWGGVWIGEEFREAFNRIIAKIDILEYVAHTFEALGDKVVVYAYERVRGKETQLIRFIDMVGIAIVTDGKVHDYRQYGDTAALQQVLGT